MRPLGLIFLVALLAPPPLHAQLGPVRGYSLTVGSAAEPSFLDDGGLGLFQRLRFMATPEAGPVDLDIAYEQAVLFRESSGVATSPLGVATATTWLDLQWTIMDDEHVTWSHRFDRLSASVSGSSWELTVGRQAISWANTLFLTPGDPFAPFDPADPFREYRAGVDAARLQYFPGPLSELEFVVRPSDTSDGTTITALARGQTSLDAAVISAWAGIVHDAAGAAVSASRSAGAFEIRGEASLREDADGGGPALRLAVGTDRRFTLADRDLYVVLEYQHDDFGAADADELVDVILSDPFSRGELTVLGRDEMALSAAYQVHPLWSATLTSLVNLRDGSGLLGPAAAWSPFTDASVRGGIFLTWGDSRASLEEGLGSEYGIAPTSAYLSLSWFF
jgi:hypothetical protein